MPKPKFKVRLNIPYIEAECARKGWSATVLCHACGLDPKTLLPALDKDRGQKVTARTLQRLHRVLGGDIAALSIDPVPETAIVRGRYVPPDSYVALGLIAQVEKARANLELAQQILSAIQQQLGLIEPPLRVNRIKAGSLIIYASIPNKSLSKLLFLYASGQLNLLVIDKKSTVALDSLVFPPSTLRIGFTRLTFKDTIVQMARRQERQHSGYRLVLTYFRGGALRARCLERYPSTVESGT